MFFRRYINPSTLFLGFYNSQRGFFIRPSFLVIVEGSTIGKYLYHNNKHLELSWRVNKIFCIGLWTEMCR